MKYIVTINDKSYEVEVEKGEAKIVRTSQHIVEDPRHAESLMTVQPKEATSSNLLGEKIKSPMPGVILDVKVSKGSTVKKGDTLFILEAMKMENEIAAPRDAVILDISILKGATVATGDVLAVLK